MRREAGHREGSIRMRTSNLHNCTGCMKAREEQATGWIILATLTHGTFSLIQKTTHLLMKTRNYKLRGNPHTAPVTGPIPHTHSHDRGGLTSQEAALLFISTLFAEHLRQVIPDSFPAELGAVPAHGGTGRQAPQSKDAKQVHFSRDDACIQRVILSLWWIVDLSGHRKWCGDGFRTFLLDVI